MLHLLRTGGANVKICLQRHHAESDDIIAQPFMVSYLTAHPPLLELLPDTAPQNPLLSKVSVVLKNAIISRQLCTPSAPGSEGHFVTFKLSDLWVGERCQNPLVPPWTSAMQTELATVYPSWIWGWLPDLAPGVSSLLCGLGSTLQGAPPVLRSVFYPYRQH